MVLCLLYLMKIFPIAQNFWKKNTLLSTAEQWSSSLKQQLTQKFTTINHWLTNCKTKNWLWKERMVMWYELTDISSPVRPNFCKFFSSIKKWRRLNHFLINKLLCIYNYLLKKWFNRWHFWHIYFFNDLMLFSHFM